MKIKLLCIISLFAYLVVSCEKDDLSYEFEAIVIDNFTYFNTVITCNPEVNTLKFTKGLDKIVTIARNSNNAKDSVYSVLNLPEDLKTQGLMIKLDIREPKDNEMPSCYNFEMPIVFTSEQLVFVVRAEKINVP